MYEQHYSVRRFFRKSTTFSFSFEFNPPVIIKIIVFTIFRSDFGIPHFKLSLFKIPHSIYSFLF